jgi:PrgI family protein
VSEHDPGPEPVRIHADIEREDRILAGLTARQAAILAGAALVLWVAFAATRRLLPPAAFIAAAAPFAVAALALAVGRRDGLSIDRLLAAAIRQARAPRRLVPAPEGVAPPPAWASQAAGARAGPLPAPLRLPAGAISPDGVVGLGGDGTAVMAAASTVNLGLRTPAEQQALTAGFGRWLNSLQTGSAQILVRACRADLTAMASAIRASAAGLPHPALETAALGHAAFLEELGRDRDLLARQVLVAVREPAPAAGGGGRGRTAALAGQRLAGAARAVASAGITVTVLDGPAATAALAACCAPGAAPPAGRAAPPGQVITAATATALLSPERSWAG